VTSAAEIAANVANGNSTANDELERSLEAIRARNDELNVFLYVDEQGARRQAAAVDEKVRRGENPGVLAGVPIAIKDNLCQRGIPTTCSSKILEGWRPPYSATLTSSPWVRRPRTPPLDQRRTRSTRHGYRAGHRVGPPRRSRRT